LTNLIALVPARSGSKRLKDKNIKILEDHPLLAYTISSCLNSNIFEEVYCLTDSKDYADIAMKYGAKIPYLRPESNSGEHSPDILWVQEIINYIELNKKNVKSFCIARPTNPFRSDTSIKKAWECFSSNNIYHSLRAVSICTEHPGKMWKIGNDNKTMFPILPYELNNVSWHSNQKAALPEIYVQNASLEFSHISTVKKFNCIAGSIIQAFVSPKFEGFDINDEIDWEVCKSLIKNKKAFLPKIYGK